MSPHRVGLIGLALLAAGCAQDMGDLEEYALEVKSRTSKNIEPIPQPKPYEPFVYEPGERRDPFLQILQSREATLAAGGGAGTLRPDLNRPKEPLEEFPLDALRMVGTITMQQRAFALVRAPDAVVHRVSVGDHLGQNYGKITGISETEVVLMEIIPDGLGGYIQRPASVALQ
ncbi:MAG: pilus assembly protein PilP [Nevskiaceae bacterium]